MSPKLCKHYLLKIAENVNADVKKRIWNKYQSWNSSHTTDSFDSFWQETERSGVARGLLGAFHGASFEEHVYNILKDNCQSSKIKCFWGLEEDKKNRKKVRFPLDSNSLSHKFDVAIYGSDDKPICVVECKTFPNKFELLGLAKLCEFPSFKKIHIFYLYYLLTTWDLKHRFREFAVKATSSIPNFKFVKIRTLLWNGAKGNISNSKYDQTRDFLDTCRCLCR